MPTALTVISSSSESIDEQVEALLHAGQSIRAIAQDLGISRRQVTNIRNQLVTKLGDSEAAKLLDSKTRREKLIRALVALTTRPEGAKRSEMWQPLVEYYGTTADESGFRRLDMDENQFQHRMKQTQQQAEKEGLFMLRVPEWLPRGNPVVANDLLVRLAGELHDLARDKVAEFTSTFPDSSSAQVFKELIAISFQEASLEPVYTRCQRNRDAAGRLAYRLGIAKDDAEEPQIEGYRADEEYEKLCY